MRGAPYENGVVEYQSHQAHDGSPLSETGDMDDASFGSETVGQVEIRGNGSSWDESVEDAPSPPPPVHEKQLHVPETHRGGGTECFSSTTTHIGGVEPHCLQEVAAGEDATRTGQGSGQVGLESAHAFSLLEAHALMMLAEGDLLPHE